MRLLPPGAAHPEFIHFTRLHKLSDNGIGVAKAKNTHLLITTLDKDHMRGHTLNIIAWDTHCALHVRKKVALFSHILFKPFEDRQNFVHT